MDHGETHSPSGYGKPPWVFRGSALYQLHLVKAETARAFIPKEFRLVEAFGYTYFYFPVNSPMASLRGRRTKIIFDSSSQFFFCRYTLGGFFLANYDDSPAGKFDELVVIAGIVWNPPTSCAWAARVLVNSDEACIHGRKVVGLPSQVAKFSKTVTAIPRTSKTKTSGFLNMVGMFSPDGPKNSMDIQVSEMKGMEEMNICNINFSAPASELESSGWMGPLVKLSLPSFSGRTKYNHHLLKYSCQIECRVRAVAPAKVLGPPPPPAGNVDEERSCTELRKKKRSLSALVLLSKPILALQFNRLEMKVESPTTVCKH